MNAPASDLQKEFWPAGFRPGQAVRALQSPYKAWGDLRLTHVVASGGHSGGWKAKAVDATGRETAWVSIKWFCSLEQ